MTLNSQVKRLAGLLGTADLNDWETRFVQSVVEQTRNGDNTTSLTERQIDAMEKLFRRNFGDAE